MFMNFELINRHMIKKTSPIFDLSTFRLFDILTIYYQTNK
jgi:hypothetical protein